MAKVAELTPEQLAKLREKQAHEKAGRAFMRELLGVQVVAQYNGTKRSSNGEYPVHTVSKNAQGVLACTCQGFRIQKTGACKHTRLYEWQVRTGAKPRP